MAVGKLHGLVLYDLERYSILGPFQAKYIDNFLLEHSFARVLPISLKATSALCRVVKNTIGENHCGVGLISEDFKVVIPHDSSGSTEGKYDLKDVIASLHLPILEAR